jgi:CHASE3 domain sensor protein
MSIDLDTAAECEREVAALLADLSEAQDELLRVLKLKRDALAGGDPSTLVDLESREMAVASRLQDCQSRREGLLASAASRGSSAKNVEELAGELPTNRGAPIVRQVREASARMRIVQNHALTNWVVAQRSLLHLSQLLAIVASGGRLTPTYRPIGGAPATFHSRGALVDREA